MTYLHFAEGKTVWFWGWQLGRHLKPQILSTKFVAITEKEGAFENVAKLTNVAWPGVSHQGLFCITPQLDRAAAEIGSKLSQQPAGEHHDVLAALTERRDDQYVWC